MSSADRDQLGLPRTRAYPIAFALAAAIAGVASFWRVLSQAALYGSAGSSWSPLYSLPPSLLARIGVTVAAGQALLGGLLFGYVIRRHSQLRRPRRLPGWLAAALKHIFLHGPRGRAVFLGIVLAGLMGGLFGGLLLWPLRVVMTGVIGPAGAAWELFFVTAMATLLGQAFVQALTRTAPPAPPECPGCGYILYHATDRRCPECGRTFHLEELDLRRAHPDEQGVLRPPSDE